MDINAKFASLQLASKLPAIVAGAVKVPRAPVGAAHGMPCSGELVKASPLRHPVRAEHRPEELHECEGLTRLNVE